MVERPTNKYAVFWTALSCYETASLLSCNTKCNVSKYNPLFLNKYVVIINVLLQKSVKIYAGNDAQINF